MKLLELHTNLSQNILVSYSKEQVQIYPDRLRRQQIVPRDFFSFQVQEKGHGFCSFSAKEFWKPSQLPIIIIATLTKYLVPDIVACCKASPQHPWRQRIGQATSSQDANLRPLKITRNATNYMRRLDFAGPSQQEKHVWWEEMLSLAFCGGEPPRDYLSQMAPPLPPVEGKETATSVC